MKFLFLLFLVGCFSLNGYSQNTDTFRSNRIAPGATLESLNSVKIYTVVQIPAQFPGGLMAWTKYLQNNLNISMGAKYLKIPKGQDMVKQTVYVTFIVDKGGVISNVMVANKNEVHPKLAAESVRVIEEGPRWVPAVQNGKNVIYRHRQGITWLVQRDL